MGKKEDVQVVRRHKKIAKPPALFEAQSKVLVDTVIDAICYVLQHEGNSCTIRILHRKCREKNLYLKKAPNTTISIVQIENSIDEALSKGTRIYRTNLFLRCSYYYDLLSRKHTKADPKEFNTLRYMLLYALASLNKPLTATEVYEHCISHNLKYKAKRYAKREGKCIYISPDLEKVEKKLLMETSKMLVSPLIPANGLYRYERCDGKNNFLYALREKRSQ